MSEIHLARPRIEIQPVGKYYETDPQGYLICPARIEYIGEEWLPVLDDVLIEYQRIADKRLHSVYLRGSVANGNPTSISDLDTWGFKHGAEPIYGFNESEKMLADKYPDRNGIEIGTRVLDVEKQALTLLMSVCIWGEDMTAQAPRLRPGIDIALRGNSSSVNSRLAKWIERLDPKKDQERLVSNIEWLSKELLRVGSELAMISSGRFTRDLYLCAKEIAEQYPEFADVSWQILDLALNPAGDTEEIKSMLEPFVGFCFYEAQRLGVTKPVAS